MDEKAAPQGVDKAVEDPKAKAARLRAEADSLDPVPRPADDMVRLRVGPPHAAFSYGGIHLHAEAGTDVHRGHLAALQRSAEEAGVTLIEET